MDTPSTDENMRTFEIVFARSRPRSEGLATDAEMNVRFGELGFEPVRGTDSFAGAKPSGPDTRLHVAKNQWTLTKRGGSIATGAIAEISPSGRFIEVVCRDRGIEFMFRCLEAAA